MSCKTYKEMLHSYINNELKGMEAAVMEKHLSDCAECRQEAGEIRQLKSVIAAMKVQKPQLDSMKLNIMASIKNTVKAKTAAYDIRVLSRLGGSLVACGLLVLYINFSTLGSSLDTQGDKINLGIQELGQKITQPISVINKGLSDMSTKINNLNGITFRIEEKIRGGM